MQGMAEPNTYLVISSLLERVEAMMTESFPTEIAVIVFDSQAGKKDKERALEFGNYLYETLQGRLISHVADTPIFASSSVTKVLEILHAK